MGARTTTRTPHVVDRHTSRAWLGSKPPEPFFLFVHYMDPHDPYFEIPYNGHGIARVSTPDSAGRARATSCTISIMEGVRYLDGYLDELFDRLEGTGCTTAASIAVTADHGEEFHEHGGWWHGTTLVRGAVHVPLIIKRAERARAGPRAHRPGAQLDIAPTLVAAAGAAGARAVPGHRSLHRHASSEPLLAEEDLEGNRLTSMRIGDWKLITANPGNPRGLAPHELYNLASDPQRAHATSPAIRAVASPTCWRSWIR